jgi:hypothetical protein
MLTSSSSAFSTCIEGLKSALPEEPKYFKYRSELSAITETAEGKEKLLVIINSLSLRTFNQLQENCALLPWPDTFKNVFDVNPLIEYFYNAPAQERSNENFQWLFIHFLKQHKYERAFELLSRAPKKDLYSCCMAELKVHIRDNKAGELIILKEIMESAHALTETGCKHQLIKTLFNRLILIDKEQEALTLELKSSEYRSKVLFLLSVYYFQKDPSTRTRAEKYLQLMPDETLPLSLRKEKLKDYYSVTKEWSMSDGNELLENLASIDRFMISTDGELY